MPIFRNQNTCRARIASDNLTQRSFTHCLFFYLDTVLQIHHVSWYMLLVFDRRSSKFRSVYVRNGRLKCNCSLHHSACQFIQHVTGKLPTNELAEFRAALLAKPAQVTVKDRISVSWKNIPLIKARWVTAGLNRYYSQILRKNGKKNMLMSWEECNNPASF